MRVCLDLSVLRSTPTGVGYYGYFLSKTLIGEFAEAQHFCAFDGLRFARLADFVNAFSRRNATEANLSQWLWNMTAPVPVLRRTWRRVKAAAFARNSSQLDLVHAISYAPPNRTAKAWLPLIHDLSHLRVPQHHPAERVRWLEAQDAVIGEAVLVNTVSEFSKAEIVALLGVGADRIRVTHPGVDPVFADARHDEDAAVLSQYDLRAGQFLLSVATIDPRKNLDTITAAFAQLPQSVRDNAVLVFAGQSGWRRVDFPKAAARLRERGEIRFIGYVPTDHLRVLYQNTALFIYSSHYEGFGIPIAEAHLAGAPVAISKGTGLREAACGLAVEIAATDVDGWSQAMRQSLDGQAWRDPQPRAARAHAARAFTWQRNAELTKRIYDEVDRCLASQHIDCLVAR
jgi:alpha-1,3-rhamnosyl/mannosyltransferase